MKTIVLEGALGKYFGTRHTFAVETAREAFFMLCQFPGFRNLYSMGEYTAEHGKGDNLIPVAPNTIDMRSNRRTITFSPAIVGGDGVVKIVLGVALFLVAPYLVPAVFGTGAFAAAALGFATSVGTALVLGGVAELLSPTPNGAGRPGDSSTTEPDYLFSGPTNTNTQGGSVPIVYGRARVGSVIISQETASELLNDGVLPEAAPAPATDKKTPAINRDTSNGGGRGGHSNGNNNNGSPSRGSDRGGRGPDGGGGFGGGDGV